MKYLNLYEDFDWDEDDFDEEEFDEEHDDSKWSLMYSKEKKLWGGHPSHSWVAKKNGNIYDVYDGYVIDNCEMAYTPKKYARIFINGAEFGEYLYHYDQKSKDFRLVKFKNLPKNIQNDIKSNMNESLDWDESDFDWDESDFEWDGKEFDFKVGDMVMCKKGVGETIYDFKKGELYEITDVEFDFIRINTGHWILYKNYKEHEKEKRWLFSKYFDVSTNEKFEWDEEEWDEEEEYIDDEHSDLRNTFKWKAMGKEPKLLKDLDTGHIINIIKYVNRHKKSYSNYGTYSDIIKTMSSELEFRKLNGIK